MCCLIVCTIQGAGCAKAYIHVCARRLAGGTMEKLCTRGHAPLRAANGAAGPPSDSMVAEVSRAVMPGKRKPDANGAFVWVGAGRVDRRPICLLSTASKNSSIARTCSPSP